MDSASSSFLTGFAMVVLGLALMARSPGSPAPPQPFVFAAGAQARGGILDRDCTGDDQRIDTVLGLTLCRGAAATPVRSEDEPQPGARIVGVAPGGLAVAAGLTADDVIYQVAGVRVTTGAEAHARLTSLPPNETSVLNFWRDGMPFLVRIRPS